MNSPAFEYVDVPEALKPFVSHYLFANRALERPLDLKVLPANRAFFTNSFSKNSHGSIYTVDGRSTLRDSRWRLGGPVFDQQVSVHEPTEIRILFCVLKATALYRLFGVNGQDLTGKNVCLSKAAPQQLPQAEICFTANESADREILVAEGNAFFAGLAKNAQKGNHLIEDAVDILEQYNGAISIIKLCKKTGASKKKLNGHFKKIVGVTPKFYAKILQVNWIIGQLKHGDSTTLSQLALKAGYYDQAHFSKDIQAFFQQSPKAFLRSKHVDLATYFCERNKSGPLLALNIPDKD